MSPAPSIIDLPVVRRLEAVSFRSWPAANTKFDGTWAIRLTAGHPAKRLNSVNPLDPGDESNLDERIKRAEKTFQAFGRPLIFRQSPLAPPQLEKLLDARGWLRFDQTKVMTLPLSDKDFSQSVELFPGDDSGYWIDQCIQMGSFSASLKPGLSELISSVEGETALFATQNSDGSPRAAAMAVRFGDLMGLFEVVSCPQHRREGHGRSIVHSALHWGQRRGATRAWLQVVANNETAIGLYQSIGFNTAYEYAYRQASDDKTG